MDIKKGQHKWRHTIKSWVERLPIANLLTFPIVINKVCEIPIKMPARFSP